MATVLIVWQVTNQLVTVPKKTGPMQNFANFLAATFPILNQCELEHGGGLENQVHLHQRSQLNIVRLSSHV